MRRTGPGRAHGARDDGGALERSYRRLLRCYPAHYRRQREEEMLAVLLQRAGSNRRRPGLTEAVDLALGGARVRWRDALTAIRTRPGRAAAVAVLAMGLLVALAPAGPAVPGPGAAVLPPRLPGYSYLTGNASDSPPGRAVALYQQGFGVEFMDFPHAVVVGASGAVRRLDLAEHRAGAATQGDPTAMLLSPDGTRVAVGVYDDAHPDVAVQHLVTGVVRSSAVGPGRAAVPVAWSPDGGTLLVVVPTEPHDPYGGLVAAGPRGRAVLLDAATGGARPLEVPGTPHQVAAAAFSPDGAHLAVQDPGGTVTILDLRGGPARALGPAAPLAGSAAWSPDGALLATEATCTGFLAVSGGPVPACVHPGPGGWHEFVGWHGPRSVALSVIRSPDGQETDPSPVVAVDVVSGQRQELTAVPTADANYQVARLQVPAAVLGAEGPAAPVAWEIDRGRWPLPLRLAAAAAAAMLALATAAGTDRLVRWARAHRAARAATG
ncbi:WD40 repeat domain-containing protein [Geodermatophilus sp. SYSU D00758]